MHSGHGLPLQLVLVEHPFLACTRKLESADQGDVILQEPAKPEAAEVEPAPRKARQATERRGLRRHVTPRKVLAVASLVGLAYLAKGALHAMLRGALMSGLLNKRGKGTYMLCLLHLVQHAVRKSAQIIQLLFSR